MSFQTKLHRFGRLDVVDLFGTPFVPVAEKEGGVEEIERVHREDNHRAVKNVFDCM